MRQPAVVDYMPGVNLLRAFSLALTALNHSPKTQETYLDAARQFVVFLEDRGCAIYHVSLVD